MYIYMYVNIITIPCELYKHVPFLNKKIINYKKKKGHELMSYKAHNPKLH
jgi:hypothetical protein